MQTKYYLTFEQVGVIRRIPIKEPDPAFVKQFTEEVIDKLRRKL